MTPILQTSILLSTAASAALALAMPQNSRGCSFHFRAEGVISGAVSQYDSGQTHAGTNSTESIFRLSNGRMVDGEDRGCWWTPPTMVLQCDAGQADAEPGFDIDCDGAVSFADQTTFYACDTGADGLYMIYLGPNGARCGEIALRADGCYPAGCAGSRTSRLPLQGLTSSWLWALPTGGEGAGTSLVASSSSSRLPLQGLTSSWVLTFPTGETTSLPLAGLTSLWGFAYPTSSGNTPSETTSLPLAGLASSWGFAYPTGGRTSQT